MSKSIYKAVYHQLLDARKTTEERRLELLQRGDCRQQWKQQLEKMRAKQS